MDGLTMPPDDRLPQALYEAYWTMYCQGQPAVWARWSEHITAGQAAWRTVAAVAREALAPPWQFQLGQRVRWAGDASTVYVIKRRRYTEEERGDGAPLVEYGVVPTFFDLHKAYEVFWAPEADLAPAAEEAEASTRPVPDMTGGS